MESVNQVKEALSACSRTATLDELRSEGRKKVRLIKAEHVAAMIADAVHAAVQGSGLLAQDEVDKLIEKSRNEFREILRERQTEVEHAREVEEQLGERERELGQRDRDLAERDRELAVRDRELLERDRQLAELRGQLQAAQLELQQNRESLAELAGQLPATAEPSAAPMAATTPPELLLTLVNELAGLKAQMAQQQTPQPVAAATDLTAALEKLTGSLNDRLEKLGRKMGVSAAAEIDTNVKFDGMFKDDGKQLESNMDNIQVKQKAGGGIAANLARLKKLKGGG